MHEQILKARLIAPCWQFYKENQFRVLVAVLTGGFLIGDLNGISYDFSSAHKGNS